MSPYTYSTEIYECFKGPEFAKKVAFKPFTLIDLTVLSDEEIFQHGLAALMEILFKHQRDKNFLLIMRKMLQNQLVQKVIKQLDISYLTDMLNYIVNTTQDESEPQAAQQLIKELMQAFPEESARRTIMTFAQQLKEEYKQEFMGTLAQQLKQEGLEQGRKKERHEMAKSLLAEGLSLDFVKKITKLPDLDLTELEKA